MKLPTLPFLQKPVPKEYFLALLLQDDMIRAVVFEENNGIINVIGEEKNILPAPLDDSSFEELLTTSDKAISSAESSLPQGLQSHKTIFGVKEDWTENLQINKDHLGTLKKLCEELDLQPIGFLVFAEAIAHLLQKEEGAPVSAVLVELGTHHITATLLRAGRVVSSHQAPVTDDLLQAVDTLLMTFTDVEILPSRIILLDNQKNPQLAKQFTNHSWNKQLPFLHMPQVTPLPDGFKTQAILFGTATQMGFDMLGLPDGKAKSDDSQTEETPPNGELAATTQKEKLELKEEELEDDEEQDKPEETEEFPHSGDEFGFVKDKDVLEAAPTHPVAYDNLQAPDDETPEEFADETFADIPEEVKEESERSRLPGIGANAVMITEGMQKIFSKLKKIPLSSYFSSLKSIPSFVKDFNSSSESSKKLLFFAPIVVILLLVCLLWYIFGVKATATLIINPKNVTSSQGVTFSSDNSTDASSDTIGSTTTPITENGSTSTQATGSQDVGDKAKGTVTIYNVDTSAASVSAQTVITSSNGKKFTLDSSVDIPAGDPTAPGTSSVSVTATDIGTDYNLPSGTKFSIVGEDSSLVAAKNDNAFSGGTKKTITVVSQADLDKLVSDLTKTLGEKAQQDLQHTNQVLLPVFLASDMSSQQFDHKVGDQTSSVSLSATITYQALSYSKGDLDKVALAIIQSNHPDESISSDNLSEDIQNPTVSKDSKSINATLSIKAGLLPKIDTTKVAQELTGKSFDQAAAALPDVPQLASVQGVLLPNLFFLPKSYPRFASHIIVGVKAHE